MTVVVSDDYSVDTSSHVTKKPFLEAG
jgi:hypothetical protein